MAGHCLPNKRPNVKKLFTIFNLESRLGFIGFGSLLIPKEE